MTNRIFLSLLAVLFSAVPVPSGQGQDVARRTDRLRQEERENYYKKWLDEDAVYIISDEERAVFDKLTTDEEREQFIEQFWFRRDPDTKTSTNEFKEEHYRRIAYANERFGSGKPGWRSDRGRIYIIHGEPAEIQENFGGPYVRPQYEGGGVTAVFPYQTWRYRDIERVGTDVEIEFVDTTLTGDYRISHDPWEKDAFANVPGIGLTEAESKGLATKHDRFLRSGGGEYYPLLALRNKDTPFARLEQYAGIMRPKTVKYNDLKEVVDVNITYNSLPFRFHQDYFRLNEDQCVVPITLELANRNLSFSPAENGRQIAKVAIYGQVSALGKQIIKEFEDEVATSFSAEHLQAGMAGKSFYQKTLVLEKGRRVKLNLVVKDLASGKLGTMQRLIIPPRYSRQDLEVSSLLLTDTIRTLDRAPEAEEMFVLGDLKIRPSLDHLFPLDKLMACYVQVYNVAMDQQSLQPSLTVSYRLLQDGKQVFEIVDKQGESLYSVSEQRVVLVRRFSPKDLGPGKYRMTIEVQDHVSNQMAMVSDEFQIVGSR